jgi:HEPN superfamily AbiU2-like protein
MAIRIKDSAQFKRLIEALALELVDANIYFRLHNALEEARGEFGRELNESWTFWSLTLQAHFDAAAFRLCRIFDQYNGALNLGADP